jgi:hypothetical protein
MMEMAGWGRWAFALALVGLLHGEARAQDLMGSIMNANLMTNFHNASDMVSASMLEVIEHPTGAHPSLDALAPLGFTATPAARREIQEAVAQELSGGSDAAYALILDDLRSGLLQREFESILRENQFDPGDLADISTAHIFFMWSVVNDEIETQLPPSTIAAVRSQLSSRFRQNPDLIDLDDRQRAYEAERLMALSMFSVAMVLQLKQQGDHDGAESFREIVRQGFLANGLDLRRVSVGDQGFAVN